MEKIYDNFGVHDICPLSTITPQWFDKSHWNIILHKWSTTISSETFITGALQKFICFKIITELFFCPTINISAEANKNC